MQCEAYHGAHAVGLHLPLSVAYVGIASHKHVQTHRRVPSTPDLWACGRAGGICLVSRLSPSTCHILYTCPAPGEASAPALDRHS